MNAIAPVNASPSGIGVFPCEGPKTIKILIDFAAQTEWEVSLETIQAKGEFSAAQTIYIDNRANDQPVLVECNASYQTFACPPGGFLYLPVLQPNPPKFKFSSAGAFVIPVHFINFFLPPICWSPDAPPGGGGGGGGVVGLTTVTDRSGASPVVVAANPNRKWLLISTPVAHGVSTFFNFGGGANVELTLGGIYETGVAVPLGIVNVSNAGGNPVVYEGE